MNTYRKTLILVILLAMFASGCSKQSALPATPTSPPPTPTTPPITQIIAFGDDLGDNGNAFRLTTKDVENKVKDAIAIPPSNLYWEGRWSNGPMPVEVMAQRLQAKLTDYAVSGSLSGTDNLIGGVYKSGEIAPTVLLNQVAQFETDLNGKEADPQALYIVSSSGGNDYWLNLDIKKYSVPDLVAEVLKNIQTAVTKLSQLGAKRFLVINGVDATVEPWFVTNKQEDLAPYQTLFQSQVPIKMAYRAKQLNIDITVFDYQAISDKIRSDPQSYSLKNLTDPCVADYFATTGCNNPDEYFFWDPWHATRKVYQVVGEAMAAVYGK